MQRLQDWYRTYHKTNEEVIITIDMLTTWFTLLSLSFPSNWHTTSIDIMVVQLSHFMATTVHLEDDMKALLKAVEDNDTLFEMEIGQHFSADLQVIGQKSSSSTIEHDKLQEQEMKDMMQKIHGHQDIKGPPDVEDVNKRMNDFISQMETFLDKQEKEIVPWQNAIHELPLVKNQGHCEKVHDIAEKLTKVSEYLQKMNLLQQVSEQKLPDNVSFLQQNNTTMENRLMKIQKKSC